jgi:hypothetical protein
MMGLYLFDGSTRNCKTGNNAIDITSFHSSDAIIQACTPLILRWKEMYANVANIMTLKRLRGLSPQANYTDRATAACQRS